ncbi:helix-turn-helix domain-containing protein [Photobacterium damselae]|uniref:helix-turn-helix domain-containing protein n=1 Tax=Photobacterium damselae TaxID=38293 RepID=UPI0035A8FCB1
MKESMHDWHSADVKSELEKLDLNFSKLARANGLAPSTMRNVLRTHWPKGEKIVADALGLNPWDIWPSRYSSKKKAA